MTGQVSALEVAQQRAELIQQQQQALQELKQHEAQHKGAAGEGKPAHPQAQPSQRTQPQTQAQPQEALDAALQAELSAPTTTPETALAQAQAQVQAEQLLLSPADSGAPLAQNGLLSAPSITILPDLPQPGQLGDASSGGLCLPLGTSAPPPQPLPMSDIILAPMTMPGQQPGMNVLGPFSSGSGGPGMGVPAHQQAKLQPVPIAPATSVQQPTAPVPASAPPGAQLAGFQPHSIATQSLPPLLQPLPPQSQGAPRTGLHPQLSVPPPLSAPPLQLTPSAVGQLHMLGGGQANTVEAARHFEAAIKLIFGNNAPQEVSTQLSSLLTMAAAGMAAKPSGGMQPIVPVPGATQPPPGKKPRLNTSPWMSDSMAPASLQSAPSADSIWPLYGQPRSAPPGLPAIQGLQQAQPPQAQVPNEIGASHSHFSPMLMHVPPIPFCASLPSNGNQSAQQLLPMQQVPTQAQAQPATPTSSASAAMVGTDVGMELPTICHICNCPYDAMAIKKYVRCRRICTNCRTAWVVNKNGLPMRFCQLCSWVHPLMNFDEGRRSCRQELKKHNDRRRRRQEAGKMQDMPAGPSNGTEATLAAGTKIALAANLP